MKTNLLSKSFIAVSMAAALAACSDDDGVSEVQRDASANTAPTHGGDILVVMNEKDPEAYIYLFGTTSGRQNQANVNASESGIVVDAEGDLLSVEEIEAAAGTFAFSGDASSIDFDEATQSIQSVSIDTGSGVIDAVGFSYEPGLRRIVVDTSAIAPELDTGEIMSLGLSFTISDGLATTTRSAGIAIVGEDVAPEFDGDLPVIFSKFDDTSSFDLLEGVTDGDDEPLSVSSVTFSDNAPAGLLSLNGSTVSVDIPSVADSIPFGDVLAITVNYNVEDHNNSLPRVANLEIRGVRLEPEAPVVDGSQSIVTSTTGEYVVSNLVAEPVITDGNGDDLTVDFTTWAPVGSAPALTFPETEGNSLMFAPSVFASYVAAGQTETFSYQYDVTDGTFTVAATVDIEVTNDGSENALANGGFEEGLTGWTEATGGIASITNSSALLDIEGTQLVAFSGGETLSTSLDLDDGALYVLEGRINHSADPWGGATIASVTGEVDGVADTSVTSAQWYGHGVRVRTFALAFDSVADATFNLTAGQASEMDDFRLYKIGFDPLNNLLAADDSNFENGAGSWVLGNGATVAVTDDVLDGSSALVSGTQGDVRNTLTLPQGTIKDGKRYALLMDVEIADFANAGGTHTFRASVVDADVADASVTVKGGAFEGVFWLRDQKQTFVTILDVARDSDATGWDTRNQALHIGTNVWGQGQNYHIDNVRLIEIP